MLRMKRSISDDIRRVRVQAIVTLLSLDDCLRTMIGKLSGGERKRLAFATVLLTDPSVVLIDEPTSGLDSYLAKELMIKIRRMAVEQRRTIIVVLHQPTNEMFTYINTLCLIVRGGRLAFFGRKDLASTFFNDECNLSASSLDNAIELLAAPPSSDKQAVHLGSAAADHFAHSVYTQAITDELLHLNQTMNDCDSDISEEWRSSLARQ
jgi:ATP-binding cassette, subfamily G (WHITE), eye pigment precursor transporter